MSRRLAAALALAAVAITGCGADDPAVEAAATASPAASQASPSPTAGTATPADEGPAAFDAAVQRTAAASERTFVSLVEVETPEGTVEVRLEGTRTGDDRTLSVTTDQGTISYAVSGGEATVDRGDGPEPVALTEVPDAPSLDALRAMADVTSEDPGLVSGTIDASAVLGGTAAATGPVEVTVRYQVGGFLEGFQLTAPNGTFDATVTFSDVAD